MTSNRFDNINLNLIIQNLQIDEQKLLESEDAYNYESPTINPSRHNKYATQNQESEYKVSSKYQGNPKPNHLNNSYSSLDEETNQYYDCAEGEKENNLSIGSCTPKRKKNVNESYDEEENCQNNLEKHTNNTQNLNGTPSAFCSPPNEEQGGKFKITLEKFKLSATSSNKKYQEQIKSQMSNQKQQILLSSNRKNCASLFDKESPNQNSFLSNKNGNLSHTPKLLNFFNSSATPQKKLITRTVNGKNQQVSSLENQESKYQNNVFMSSQPCRFYQGSDQKSHKKNQPSYSKKLFQEDSDDECEQQEQQQQTELQDSEKRIKQNLISRFDQSDQKVRNRIAVELDKIEEFNSPLPTSNNLLGSLESMNNIFASPLVNSSKKKVTLFPTNEFENEYPLPKEMGANITQPMKTNNLFSTTTDTLPKKGTLFQKDEQTTIKKNVFNNINFCNNAQISNLNQVSSFFSKEKSNQSASSENSTDKPSFSQFKEVSNQANKFLVDDENKNNNDLIQNPSNKLNGQIPDFNLLNLPQVNEFSFETEKEEDQSVSNRNLSSIFENKVPINAFNNNNSNYFDEYDSDNFIRKRTHPTSNFEKEADTESQSEDTSLCGQSSIAGEDYFPESSNLQLIKGKSVNLFYENDLRNQNESNVWNLGLNRRNSEVGLDNNDQSGRISIDIGENEFTKAMPGIKQQRQRLGSLVQNKKRSQTVLFQIPEDSMKKQQQPKFINNQLTSAFENEDDFEVQTPIRSKMIEQQDFSILFKKASSQFFTNSLAERDYMPSDNRHHHSKENRFTKDFKILSIIKQTPLSSVYKCQSNVNGLIYAIKVISIPQDSVEQERIIQEVQSLVKFSTYGFGILKFYNVWMEDSKLYLVTEHCLHNLRHIRNTNQKPSEQLIRQIIRDICESLNFLHTNECAHLGIKPENILVSKKMKFKLADLGYSKIQLSENNISQQESYFPYIAPELVGGCSAQKQNLKSMKADIFSFGAVLYELMTDQDLPKYGPEWENLRSGRFPKLMNSVKYSASLKNLIKSMLLRNPQLRPSCQDILNQIPSDNAQELELKYMVEENNLLQKKLEELQKKADQTNNSNYQNSNSNNNCLLKKKTSF